VIYLIVWVHYYQENSDSIFSTGADDRTG